MHSSDLGYACQSRREEELEDVTERDVSAIDDQLSNSTVNSNNMKLHSLVLPTICHSQDPNERKDTDTIKLSVYEAQSGPPRNAYLRMGSENITPVVGGMKRRDTHLNIDVTVSKWSLEVKVDMKVVSVQSYV